MPFHNNMNRNMQQNYPQNMANFGAHEIMEAHEVLTDTIDGINQFELYRPHVQDQRLQQILDRQVSHMVEDYNNMVNYLHQRGGMTASTYRAPRTGQTRLGLRNPSPETPNTSLQQMNDRDVASGMLGCAKATAIMSAAAALEVADPTLREMVANCSQSAINMAYETFQYLNENGYYQVPTMQDNTTQTIIDSYQPASMPQMGQMQMNQMGQAGQMATAGMGRMNQPARM